MDAANPLKQNLPKYGRSTSQIIYFFKNVTYLIIISFPKKLITSVLNFSRRNII